MNVEHRIRQHPRLKDEIALLFVKREPRYLNGTARRGEIKSRVPLTPAVAENPDVVCLRRDLVIVGHLSTVIDIKPTELQLM